MMKNIDTEKSQKMFDELANRLELKEKLQNLAIKTQAVDIIMATPSKSQEGSLSGKEVIVKPSEFSWLSYSALVEALGYAVSPITYTYQGVVYLMEMLESDTVSFVVDLFTAKGIRGSVCSTMGTALGTVCGIRSAEYISSHLIHRTVSLGCHYLGKNAWIEKFFAAGAVVIVGPAVETTTVVVMALAGGEMAVLIGNAIYLLLTQNTGQKELIEEWNEESNRVLELNTIQ